MSTLQLINWDKSATHELQAWTDLGSQSHYTVEVVEEIRPHLFKAYFGPRDGEPTSVVALKTALGKEQIDLLAREIDFYDKELLRLQGIIVPKVFGKFKGKVGRTEVGCIVMEFCEGPPPRDMLEHNRQIMMACCRLHIVGVTHGNLFDGRHFVTMRNGVRIVDFSTAVRHRCPNGIPTLIGSAADEIQSQCLELQLLERSYGISSGTVKVMQKDVRRRFWLF